MGPRGGGVHLGCCDGPVPAPLLHFLLDAVVGVDEVLAHPLHVNAESLVLPDLVALLGTLSNRNEQVLHLLIINLHHRDLHLVLLVRVAVLGNPRENFLAGNGDDALREKQLTLLAP